MDKSRVDLYIEDVKLFDYAANTAKLVANPSDNNTTGTLIQIKKAFNNIKKMSRRDKRQIFLRTQPARKL